MPELPSRHVTVRVELPDDAAAVRDVALRSFGPGEEVAADLVDALRTSSAAMPGLSFVACVPRAGSSGDGAAEGDDVVGHLLLTRSWLDAPERLVEVLVLSPPGVVPGGGLGFLPPSDRIPAPAFQVTTLCGYEPWMRGRLVYADTFWALDCVGPAALTGPASRGTHLRRTRRRAARRERRTARRATEDAPGGGRRVVEIVRRGRRWFWKVSPEGSGRTPGPARSGPCPA